MENELIPRFNKSDLETLKTYFVLNKKYYWKVHEQLTTQLQLHPLWGPILQCLGAEEIRLQNERSLQLQHDAIYEGRWKIYAKDIINQTKRYAEMNVTYTDWYEVIRMYKFQVIPYVKKDFVNATISAIIFLDGLSKCTDYIMYFIAQAYFEEQIKAPKQLISIC